MGWDQDQYERSFSDSGKNKRYGETYLESWSRQSEEQRARDDAAAQEKADRQSKELERRGSYSVGSGSYTSTERTYAAKVAGTIGWGLLFVAGLCYVTNNSYSPFEGMTLTGLAFKASIGFLVLGYLAHLVALIAILLTCLMVYANGYTPAGFQFDAVPSNVWLISVLLIAFAVVFGRVFGRK
jgi:FtsH-binding integral membrane protein